MKRIGPTFAAELKTAGLLGLQFAWGDDGQIQFTNMPQDKIDAVNAVYAAHDPTKAEPAQAASPATDRTADLKDALRDATYVAELKKALGIDK